MSFIYEQIQVVLVALVTNNLKYHHTSRVSSLLLHAESSNLYFINIPDKPVDLKLNQALKVIASN